MHGNQQKMQILSLQIFTRSPTRISMKIVSRHYLGSKDRLWHGRVWGVVHIFARWPMIGRLRWEKRSGWQRYLDSHVHIGRTIKHQINRPKEVASAKVEPWEQKHSTEENLYNWKNHLQCIENQQLKTVNNHKYIAWKRTMHVGSCSTFQKQAKPYWQLMTLQLFGSIGYQRSSQENTKSKAKEGS